MCGRYKSDCIDALSVAEKTSNPRRSLLTTCDFLFGGLLLAYLVILAIYAAQIATAKKNVDDALVTAKDGFFALVYAYVGDMYVRIDATYPKFV